MNLCKQEAQIVPSSCTENLWLGMYHTQAAGLQRQRENPEGNQRGAESLI